MANNDYDRAKIAVLVGISSFIALLTIRYLIAYPTIESAVLSGLLAAVVFYVFDLGNVS